LISSDVTLSVPRSGLQEAPEPVAYLLMRQKFAPLESGLAPFHGFDTAVFFL
jgi:hypothetical protein